MENIYSGKLLPPGVDYGMVRDGRRSPIMWGELDLSVARSIQAGTGEVINIAGDAFYADLDPVNQGTAVIRFEDVNLSAPGAPIYITRGHIIQVPFTRLLVENEAQPGKRLRYFYGVGIDFEPGSSSSVNVSGVVSVNDEGEARSDALVSYIGQGFISGPGSVPHAQLWNPPASGKELIVQEVQLARANGGVSFGALCFHTAALGALGMQGAAKKAGSPASVAEIRTLDGAAVLGTTIAQINIGDAAKYEFRDPIILPPGFGLHSRGTSAISAGATFQWYERSL